MMRRYSETIDIRIPTVLVCGDGEEVESGGAGGAQPCSRARRRATGVPRTRVRRSDAGGHRRGGRLLQGSRLLPVRGQARPVPGAARAAASPSGPNRTRASRPAWPGWTGCVPCWTPTPASPRRVATGPGCSSSSGSSPRATPPSMPGTPRCTPRPSITSPRRSRASWPGPGSASAYPPRAFAELILAIDAGRVLERAAGTSELRLEHLVDLLGRALVPAGFDDDTGTNTPPPGGHDAHHDRTEALVPRTP